MLGAQYQARVLCGGRRPFDESAAIEPLLRGLREEMRRAQPELGLWYSMDFRLYADGHVIPSFDYDSRPAINESPALVAEADSDLARAPRPERWTPTWVRSA